MTAQSCYFMKSGLQPINDRVRMVEFDLSGPHIRSYSHLRSGERISCSAWLLRDARSLVETGHWVETDFNPDLPKTAAEAW